MARIPEAEIERLKREIALERLVEARGVVLKRKGADLVGWCPFATHQDSEPSFVVTPAKNLWHCVGCRQGGSVIDWVMKTEGVSFRHAVELLRDDNASLATAQEWLRESGHEHFNGSLVIPIFDEQGAVTEIYGRKIVRNLQASIALHLYLPGPHRGVWNIEALQASKEIILCEALIDALIFWCAGYRNVTASYGVEGFTEDYLAAFKRYGTERVLIAYDRDDAGEKAASVLTERLIAQGLECFRIHFPKGMDANEYALTVKPAEKSLGVLIPSAIWLGGSAREAPSDNQPSEIGNGVVS